MLPPGKGAPPAPAGVTDAEPAVAAALAPPARPPAGARTAAALDTTTPEQRAAAKAVAETAGDRRLGQVSATLGNPTEPGFWLSTALVDAPGPGRVELSGGASVAVELRPAGGSGSTLLSLAAFRALGLGLTDLPEVTVFAR